MVKHKITVYHVYQDKHNPATQTIVVNGEYGMNYALMQALIDSCLDFKVEIARDEE